MTMAPDRMQNLLADLRIPQMDFNAVFNDRNELTPLEAVERFLQEYHGSKSKNEISYEESRIPSTEKTKTE